MQEARSRVAGPTGCWFVHIVRGCGNSWPGRRARDRRERARDLGERDHAHAAAAEPARVVVQVRVGEVERAEVRARLGLGLRAAAARGRLGQADGVLDPQQDLALRQPEREPQQGEDEDAARCTLHAALHFFIPFCFALCKS